MGPYEISSPLGAGGMGEVYKARDTRLNRSVAIKVLPEHIAKRDDLRARFEREARAVASLNHPNICTLHDIGNQDDIRYLVMELMEGETLAARIDKGAIPLKQALTFATQIAYALDCAHRAGVAHRDLKPGNIMLTRDGVKVLDFGLAKSAASGGPNDATLSEALTVKGAILGTPQYMAPEQVEGKETDARTDIFAFGSVLYEMVSGKKAFAGDSQAAVLSAILRVETPSILDSIPALLNRALKICWAKDPDERWQSAGDLRRELQWIAEGGEHAAPGETKSFRRREAVAWGAAAIFGVAGAAAMSRGLRSSGSPQPTVHFTIAEPPGMVMNPFQSTPAVSPDGKMVAFSAGQGGRQSIWLRMLHSLDIGEVPDTNDAVNCFWSPDSRAVGFFAEGKLKRVNIASGPAQAICDTPRGFGAWNQDGTIVFTMGMNSAYYRVPAEGGTPAALPTTEILGHTRYTRPSFLPDGKTMLFGATSNQPERQGVYATRLDSGQTTRLLTIAGTAAYIPPGFLLVSQQGKLVAHRFDAGRLRLEGDAIPVAEGLFGFSFYYGFSVSNSGVLAYAETEHFDGQLAWFDRSGKRLANAGPSGPYVHIDLSRDERRVLLERFEGGHGDLWALDLARDVPSRLTFGPGWNFAGYWSPDGTQFVHSKTIGSTVIVQRPAGGKQERQLVDTGVPGPTTPTHWSPDGRYIVYSMASPATSWDLWIVDLSGDQKPYPYLQTQFMEVQGRVSPDGRWLAYVSNESGAPEVYIGSFPHSGATFRVSIKGGVFPSWRADGKELFYLTPDQTLMAVAIRGKPDQAGSPEPLFTTPIVQYRSRMNYASSADGKRFLVNTRLEAAPHAIHVIANWSPGKR